jgi:hypothetical protein
MAAAFNGASAGCIGVVGVTGLLAVMLPASIVRVSSFSLSIMLDDPPAIKLPFPRCDESELGQYLRRRDSRSACAHEL